MRPCLLALGMIVTTLPAFAGDLSIRPNDALTPGAIASTDPTDVCGFVGGLSYSRRHRVWHDKDGTLSKYGLPWSAHGLVEDDDRVPVCLGGDNADPRNHWPQTWAQAEEKDQLEAAVCRMVCRDHDMSLQEGQAIFLGDWIAGYQKVFGRAPE